jgi:hypothetical protein
MLAVDMACSIATGHTWHGMTVEQKRVLFIATEGRNGVCRLRIAGWMDHHKIPVQDRQNISALRSEIYIDKPEDINKLLHDLKVSQFGLVVIDIGPGTMEGSESDDLSAKAWVANIERIIALGITVIVTWHTGWANQERSRGHTHIWGSFYSRLKAEGDKETRTATLAVDRIKDFDSVGKWGFRFDLHNFTDADGNELGTLIPVMDDEVRNIAKAKTAKQRPLKDNRLIVFNALDLAVATMGEASKQFTGMPTNGHVCTRDQWETIALPKLPHEKLRDRNQAFGRATESLVGSCHVGRFEDYYWVI